MSDEKVRRSQTRLISTNDPITQEAIWAVEAIYEADGDSETVVVLGYDRKKHAFWVRLAQGTWQVHSLGYATTQDGFASLRDVDGNWTRLMGPQERALILGIERWQEEWFPGIWDVGRNSEIYTYTLSR
jgi:hypothetical protein